MRPGSTVGLVKWVQLGAGSGCWHHGEAELWLMSSLEIVVMGAAVITYRVLPGVEDAVTIRNCYLRIRVSTLPADGTPITMPFTRVPLNVLLAAALLAP